MMFNIFKYIKGALVTTGVLRDNINEIEGFSTVTDKINYLVPTGKVLKITGWTATASDGTMNITFRIDGVLFDGAGLAKLGSTSISKSVDPQVPLAEAPAGAIVDAVRIDGDIAKVWFVSIQGYLEDV